MTETKKTSSKTSKKKAVLRVTTKRDGFRRAGRAWHGTTEVAVDELTEQQVRAIKSEPMLVVDEVA